MDIAHRSFLKSSIVLLVEGMENRQVPSELLLDILGELPEPLVLGERVLVFTSVRKQMEIRLARDRVDVVERGGKEPGSAALGDALLKLRRFAGGRVTAIGYNYSLELPLDSEMDAGTYMTRNYFFRQASPNYEPATLLSISFAFPLRDARCTTRLEPRWGDADSDKLYLDVNVHRKVTPDAEIDAGLLGSGEQVDSDFDGVFKDVEEALKSILVRD